MAARAGSSGESREGAQVRGHVRSVSGCMRAELVRALARFCRIDTALGVRLLAVDLRMIAAGFALVLLADALWLRAQGSLLVGFKLGAVYALAHDAVHGNLVCGAALNRWIATFCYGLTFHNHRTRQCDHMLLGHHPNLNGPQHDAWRPLSPQEFAAASTTRRSSERALRSPVVVSFFACGVAERWWRAEFFPPAPMPAQHNAKARVLHAAAVAWMLGLVALGVASAQGRGSPLWLEVLLIFGLTTSMFQTLQAMVLCMQHTHLDVPWFGSGDALIERFGPESLTAHVLAPRIRCASTHDILEHPAHHVVPAIPCRRLHEAQAVLSRLLGARALRTQLFGLRRLAQVMGTCKLCDDERHRWPDFAGRPTAATQSAALLAERAPAPARTLLAA
jgi:omega-6 fatty acid desaturase (delta-12 desaturase)